MEIRNLIKGVFIIVMIIVTGCTGSALYEKSFDFENKEWAQNVKPSFTVDIKDTTTAYNFIITLRTTTEYKFSNLWIYLNTATPDGQKVREPYEMKITNPDGSWAGKKTGTIVEKSIYFKNSVFLFLR